MLQASTGKLFTNHISHSNLLRGVLYTNMTIHVESEIETVFGRIYPTSMQRQPNVISCEITENIEYFGTGPGILYSNTIDIYLGDFADILAFSLNTVCTPDVELANRLLNENPRPGSTPPKKLIKRLFEKDIHITSAEIDELKKFTTELHGLQRKHYLKAIKAIRTYITATHRLSENLDLAYTLLVMSIEALVQDSGAYTSQWSDVEEGKRTKLEAILGALDKETSENLKRVIVESEHLSLTKKFNHFILSHIPAAYFTHYADKEENPIGKADLESALSNLYGTRSKYVHELKALPREFSHFSGTGEITLIDEKPILTIQGLTRLARAVIKEFIRKQKKVEHEPCDYNIDNPNIARMKLCPSTWITRADGIGKDTCSMYFSGFVTLLDDFFYKYPAGTLYDVKNVIEKGFAIKENLSQAQRTSIVTLAALFNALIAERFRPIIELTKIDHKLSESPSIQVLIMAMVFGVDTGWHVTTQEREFKKYYKTRFKKTGFRLPHRLEAGLGLALAEKYRITGDHAMAIAQLNSTAENFPKINAIREYLKFHTAEKPISWMSLIYPNLVKKEPLAHLECDGL